MLAGPSDMIRMDFKQGIITTYREAIEMENDGVGHPGWYRCLRTKEQHHWSKNDLTY